LVSHLLQSIPPEAVYLIVGLMIMVESLGIPVPGEIALVTAAVLATQHKMALSPAWIAASASAGAIAGDSMGYLIGHRAGSPLFDWLGRKFPRHFGPGHVALAERVFTRHGVWAVFFGRFIALLRIFAGPLAGSLRMPYPRFLVANATGGIVWATGITYLIWFLGVAAEKWMSRLSWLGLVAAVLVGLGITLLVRRKTTTLAREAEARADAEARAEAEAQPDAEAARAGAQTAPAGTQPAPRTAAGAPVAAGAGAQTANGRTQAEPDRVPARREGAD
jgi:membrane protein DedA with SNARE-associated domain